MTATCNGNQANCEQLTALAALSRARYMEFQLTATDAVVNAMAVGLVVELWRNGPTESMHSNQRGPSDAAMFAESTDLQIQAVHALASPHRAIELLNFERHLLDRERPWAGTGGRTLRDLGYGHLGDYARHVKGRTNTMLGLVANHTCVDDPLEGHLVNTALMFGRNHKGMPGWTVIVKRIGILLEEPDHPAWRDNTRGVEVVTQMPPEIASIDTLIAALLDRPSYLSDEVRFTPDGGHQDSGIVGSAGRMSLCPASVGRSRPNTRSRPPAG